MGHRQFLARGINLDPDPEHVALLMMLMVLLHDDAATRNPIREALELGGLFADRASIAGEESI